MRPPAPLVAQVGVHPMRRPIWRDHCDQLENLVTIGKTVAELTNLANEALRNQPGCATAIVPGLYALPNVRAGRNWEIPNVILGESLISDVDRAVITVHHQLGRIFHLLTED
jgi:hypothetical protein